MKLIWITSLETVAKAEAKAAHDVAIDCAANAVFGQLYGCGPLCPRRVGPERLRLA